MDVVTATILAVASAGSLVTGSLAADDVKWNQGSGPAQMSKGLPNPPGWYRAAVGVRSDEKVLYLTFDDGPSRFTSRLLRMLKKHDAAATFFVTGAAAQANSAVLKRMSRNGHEIGNHTWGHPRLTLVSTPRVRGELRRTEEEVGPALGSCMRPPYGMINRRVANASIAAGFQPVMWTAHIEDWAPHSFSWTMKRLRQSTKPGAVILMHDTHWQTVAAVRAMLPKWHKKGYRFATLPACEKPA